MEWAERKKRALETSRKAKQDDAERECTFQPRIVNRVPDFMRHIAAHQRQLRGSVSTDGGGDGPLDGISGALTAATSR